MAQHIYTAAVDPSAAPAGLGHHYINTATAAVWQSVGTASVNDWVQLAPATYYTPTSGAGTPEGVVTGSPGRTYVDTSVDPPGFWVKYSGSATNTGWRQLIG